MFDKDSKLENWLYYANEKIYGRSPASSNILGSHKVVLNCTDGFSYTSAIFFIEVTNSAPTVSNSIRNFELDFNEPFELKIPVTFFKDEDNHIIKYEV